MSQFSRFMKANKIVKKNEFYAPTVSLVDEEEKPLLWEFKHLTSKENEDIRESCTYEVQITGKPNSFRHKMNTSLYLAKMICASVVAPDLYDAQLQDSYGVKTPEELLFALVDDPGEYNDLGVWMQNFQGFNKGLDEKVEEAKN